MLQVLLYHVGSLQVFEYHNEVLLDPAVAVAKLTISSYMHMHMHIQHEYEKNVLPVGSGSIYVLI